jgi:gliding motility-associated-like protein
MKIKYLYLLLLFPIIVQAQTIKRWTFCSAGITGKVPITNTQNVIVANTFGQCPGCSVISDGQTTLRQGFQQPIQSDTTQTGGGNPQDCLYKVAFSNKSKTDNCGTYFDFEYEGDKLPGMTFLWDFGPDGSPSTSTDASPSKIGFASAGPQVIKLTVINKTCPKSQSTIVNAATKSFAAQAKTTDVLCYGQKTGSIVLTVTGGNTPITYQWSNNTTTKDLFNIVAGNYTYVVQDAKGCTAKNNITIKSPSDSLTLITKVKDESCKDDKDGEIKLNVAGGKAPYIFLWNDKAFTQDRENLTKGIYTVTVTDANSCKNGLAIDLKRFCEKKETDFPNSFSPNGDGVNDTWVFPGIDEFPKNETTIFNRWGGPVWEKTGMKNGDWYGQNRKDENLPSGPYYYLIKLNDRDNTIFSGAVTIVR